MSLIKLKTEEMEAQVSFLFIFTSDPLKTEKMLVLLLWSHQCFKTIYFLSLGLSGEGAAVGKPAGAGADPSRGAEEEAL